MYSNFVVITAFVTLASLFGCQHCLAGAGVTAPAQVPALQIVSPERVLIHAGGAGGGAVFWSTGTPYGPMYSYRGKRHFRHHMTNH
jgi:hypothetical protein